MFSKCAFIKFLKIQSFVSLLLSDNVNCAWGSKTKFYKFIHTLPVVKHKIFNYGTITMVQFILLIHFMMCRLKVIMLSCGQISNILCHALFVLPYLDTFILVFSNQVQHGIFEWNILMKPIYFYQFVYLLYHLYSLIIC